MATHFEFPEGSTPIFDASGLIPAWVHNLGDLNRVEAENIIDAQRKFLRAPVGEPKNWFRIRELKAIHHAMFGNVWKWAGSYRTSVTSIGVKPNLIPMQLSELCQQVLSWSEHPVELTFVEMAARIHHRLVSIHPFENGNGRFSRLIADRFLLAWRCSYPIWPHLLNQESVVRSKYIQTLKSADKGDYGPLVDLMKELGAADPKLSELIEFRFYRAYLTGDKGYSLVKALLKQGSLPNEENANGYRVLQLAVKAGLTDIAKLLVEAGAEVDFKDPNGQTPFQLAEMKENKSLTDFFLSRGAKTS